MVPSIKRVLEECKGAGPRRPRRRRTKKGPERPELVAEGGDGRLYIHVDDVAVEVVEEQLMAWLAGMTAWARALAAAFEERRLPLACTKLTMTANSKELLMLAKERLSKLAGKCEAFVANLGVDASAGLHKDGEGP